MSVLSRYLKPAGLVLGAVLLTEVLLLAYYNAAHLSPPIYEKSDDKMLYALKPAVHAKIFSHDRFWQVTTNQAGQRSVDDRGDHSRAEAKNDRGTLHLIGDSQVFGWGLSDHETLGYQLQQELRSSGQRVKNHGVPGYGPYEYLEVMASIPKQDKVVLFLTEENDTWDAYKIFKTGKIRCRFLVSYGGMEFLHQWCFVLRSRIVQTLLALLEDSSRKYMPTPIGFSDVSIISWQVLTSRIYGLLGEEIKSRGTNILVATIPWKGRYDKEWSARYRPIPNVADAHYRTFPFSDGLDTVGLFYRLKDQQDLYIKGDSHLSTSGVDVLTQQVVSWYKRTFRQAE